MTVAALHDHFAAVADASVVPVVLYNIPQNTNVALAPELVARLSTHENIAGIKDSSGDMVNLVEMLRLTAGRRDQFIVMTGHAGLLYASLCAGVRGAILAAACVAPRVCKAIFSAVQEGEHERARALQSRLAPVARAVTTRYGVGGLKAALDVLGYSGGVVRSPLRSPDEDARRDLAKLVEELADEDSSRAERRAEEPRLETRGALQ
jgi:4-hydroxy-2-oxoglutarate aldolase